MYYIAHIVNRRDRALIEEFTNENQALLWLRRLKEDGNIKSSELREFKSKEESDEYMYELLDKYN